MQGYFHIKREEKNKLAYGQTKNEGIDVGVHFHSQIEVYQICSGQVEVLINDKRRVLSEGEIAVSFSYDAHGYRSVGPAEATYLIVPTDAFPDLSPYLSGKQLGSPFIDDQSVCHKVRTAMNGVLSADNELTARGWIYVIFGTVFSLGTVCECKEQRERQTRLGAELLIYVGKHFREELTLGTLGEHFGYNPSYLSRYFRDTFGISFGKYLTTLRLREAVLLLRQGDLTVTECALESGFGSIRSFYRCFYEEFKCTPKEYLSGENQT